VAEAAALLAAGPGARIAVAKRRSANATCAIAEEARWPG
jgi:cobalamin biosynthesis protein CbiG